MGLKNMTKSKNRSTKWQFFDENHQFGKVVEIKGIDNSLVHIDFSRTEIDGLKNRSGICESSGGGVLTGSITGVGNVKDRARCRGPTG
jgi:hypothetical protein